MTSFEGNIKKMNAEIGNPIQYSMVISDKVLPISDYLESNISLKWNGIINCVSCGNITKKSFFQGFCYPCFISAPESSECILKPELCQAHEGVSRDMAWSKKYCLSDHYVYLSLTSGVKVGVTRHSQIPTRWIDQGAIKALKIAKTPNRYLAGIIEIALKSFVSDRTSWQKMLKNEVDSSTDLHHYKRMLQNELSAELKKYILDDEQELLLYYPTKKYPQKIKSINFDKKYECEGKLTGIKGQYLYLDSQYVINIRKYGGYYFQITCF